MISTDFSAEGPNVQLMFNKCILLELRKGEMDNERASTERKKLNEKHMEFSKKLGTSCYTAEFVMK